MSKAIVRGALKLLPAELNPVAVMGALPEDARCAVLTLLRFAAGAAQLRVDRAPAAVCICSRMACRDTAVPSLLLEAAALEVGTEGNTFGLPAGVVAGSPLERQAMIAAKALDIRSRTTGGIVNALIALYGDALAGRICGRFVVLVANDADPAVREALGTVCEVLNDV